MTIGQPPFDVLLDEAMNRRGLSLGRIRYHLRRRGHDLSVATLSYWRRGLSRPTRAKSMAAVIALEEVLDVPPGTLTGALEERQTPDDSGAPGVDQLADELGLGWSSQFTHRSVHDRIVLGPDGRQVSHHVRTVVEAREDGVDRFPFAYWVEDEVDRLRIEGREGCAVTRSARNETGLVAEITLPRPLRRGEAWMSEVALVMAGQANPMVDWGRCLTSETRIVHFTVAFDPEKVPLRAESVIALRGVETRRPLVLRGPRVDLHLEDFGPGDVGIEWSW